MRGGMKSGQGIPLRAYLGPPSEGLPGCGHDLRNPNPSAGRYGGKGENEAFSLVAPPCDPVSASPSVPKAKLLLEHEDVGRTGRRSTLKGKGDSGGGCKEGPRGGNRRFPTTGPSLAPPGGHRGNYRRTGIKRENSDVTPPLPRAKPLCSLPACSNKSFAFGTGGRKHPSPHGGRHEVTTRVFPFVCTPARRRRDCRGAGTT